MIFSARCSDNCKFYQQDQKEVTGYECKMGRFGNCRDSTFVYDLCYTVISDGKRQEKIKNATVLDKILDTIGYNDQ